MRRREFIGLVGGAATAWPFAARAQQPALPVIGYFSAGAAEPSAHTVSEFRKGLAETGYAEGLNVQIEYRWANNQAERLSELAADLIRMPTDVVANFISEQVSADDLLILGILAPGYLLAIPVTAFLAKRGLFIGKNADEICFPGDQGGSGIYYSKEREILTSRPLQPIRKDLVIRFRRQRLAREAIMAAKEISVKKYVVRLSGEERERLETLIGKGKSPARRVLKAGIFMKADVSEAGKG